MANKVNENLKKTKDELDTFVKMKQKSTMDKKEHDLVMKQKRVDLLRNKNERLKRLFTQKVNKLKGKSGVKANFDRMKNLGNE